MASGVALLLSMISGSMEMWMNGLAVRCLPISIQVVSLVDSYGIPTWAMN